MLIIINKFISKNYKIILLITLLFIILFFILSTNILIYSKYNNNKINNLNHNKNIYDINYFIKSIIVNEYLKNNIINHNKNKYYNKKINNRIQLIHLLNKLKIPIPDNDLIDFFIKHQNIFLDIKNEFSIKKYNNFLLKLNEEYNINNENFNNIIIDECRISLFNKLINNKSSYNSFFLSKNNIKDIINYINTIFDFNLLIINLKNNYVNKNNNSNNNLSINTNNDYLEKIGFNINNIKKNIKKFYLKQYTFNNSQNEHLISYFLIKDFRDSNKLINYIKINKLIPTELEISEYIKKYYFHNLENYNLSKINFFDLYENIFNNLQKEKLQYDINKIFINIKNKLIKINNNNNYNLELLKLLNKNELKFSKFIFNKQKNTIYNLDNIINNQNNDLNSKIYNYYINYDNIINNYLLNNIHILKSLNNNDNISNLLYHKNKYFFLLYNNKITSNNIPLEHIFNYIKYKYFNELNNKSFINDYKNIIKNNKNIDQIINNIDNLKFIIYKNNNYKSYNYNDLNKLFNYNNIIINRIYKSKINNLISYYDINNKKLYFININNKYIKNIKLNNYQKEKLKQILTKKYLYNFKKNLSQELINKYFVFE